MYCHIIVALVVIHAVFRIGKKSIDLRTVKIRLVSTIVIAIPTVAVSIPTTDILWKIAPFMRNVIQVILLARHVIQAAIIAFPVSGAVLRIRIDLAMTKPR